MSRARHARKSTLQSRLRAALPIGAAVLVAGAALLAVSPSSAVAATNPVRPASVSSHGFGVLVEHDATLLGNESETGVAIGGTLTFGNYQVVDKDTGAYTAAGDSAPTALVAGAVDWSASRGLLQVTQSMGAKIGGGYDVNTTNANAPRLVATGAGFDSTPRVDVTAPVTAVAPTGPSGFDLPQLFASYRASADDLAVLTDTGVLRNDAGTGPWVSGNARLVLAPGQNVLTITPAQLAALGSVNPGGGATLGAGTWLIVNVVGAGDLTLSGPTAALATAGGANPQTHVLWNLTTSGTVTVAGNDQLEGTLFAPRARVIDDSGKNIEGDVVVASLHQSGGEIHGFHFAHDVDVPPTPPGTTTTTTTTTTAAPSTVTVTAPGTTTTRTETVTQTQTAPGTTETVTAPATTDTVTQTAPGTTTTVTAGVDGGSTSAVASGTSTSVRPGRTTATSTHGVDAASTARTGDSSPSSPALANTGVEIGMTVALGIALLLGGVALVALTARSGRRHH